MKKACHCLLKFVVSEPVDSDVINHVVRLRSALGWRTMLPRHGPGVRYAMKISDHKNPLQVKNKHLFFNNVFESVFLLYASSRIFILLSRESEQSAVTSSLRRCQPPLYHFNGSHYVPFLNAKLANMSVCSPHCLFVMLSVKQGSCKYQFKIH